MRNDRRRVTCEEFVRALPDFLDGEVEPAWAVRLEEHVGWCVGCLRKYRFEHEVIDGIAARLQSVGDSAALEARMKVLLTRVLEEARHGAPDGR